MHTYLAYLDEFGHVGPYVSRTHSKYKTSPVFGLGGIILPASTARRFSAWFHWKKATLFKTEIARSGIPSYHWEKKGSKLFTTHGRIKYDGNNRELLKLVLDKLTSFNGHIIFNGMKKYMSPDEHNSDKLYLCMLSNILLKIHNFCRMRSANAIVVLDENGGVSQRTKVVDRSARELFGGNSLDTIVEPVFQAESHLYQNLQCADWICAVLTRLYNHKSAQREYPELSWTINDGYEALILQHAAESNFLS